MFSSISSQSMLAMDYFQYEKSMLHHLWQMRILNVLTEHCTDLLTS